MALSDSEKEDLLRSFYNERLMPLADLARSRGVVFFPLGSDETATSYYRDRSDDESYIHEIDADKLAASLRELWAKGELPEVAELSDDIAALALVLKVDDKEALEEVSPFIYAMF